MQAALRRLGWAPTAAITLVVVAVAYWRLYYGIDFTDESFYVAVPYRFVLGARPFVDDTGIQDQTAALLVYPFIRAYYAAAGVTGIVLYMRHLQLLFSLAVALAVVTSLRAALGGRNALIVALAAIAFVPFNIHGLGYNALASGLFTAGTLLAFRARSRAAAAVAGACLGLAAFAYPPLAIPVALAVVVRIVLARRAVASFVVTAAGLPLLGAAALVALVGARPILDDYRSAHANFGEGGGMAKLRQITVHEWTSWHHWYLVLAALALLALLWRWQRRLAPLALLALPFLVLPSRPGFYSASLEYVARYGWLALPLYLLIRRRPAARLLLSSVWLPSLAAGLTTAYSSANGGVNFGVGFFPASIVTSVFLVWSLEDARFPRAATAIPALTVLVVLLVLGMPVYRDGPISRLHARVASGPYAGLLTSYGKRAFLTRLQSDLEPLPSSCRIAFFNDFPAGYLLTRAQPDTNSTWTFSVSQANTRSYQSALVGYYRRRGYPDVAVVMHRIPYAPDQGSRLEHYTPRAPLLVALRRQRFTLVRRRPDYAIYVRPSGGCSLLVRTPRT